MSRMLSMMKMGQTSTAFSTGSLLLCRGADVGAVYEHTYCYTSDRRWTTMRRRADGSGQQAADTDPPVISTGWARPSRASAVGARSHNLPPSRTRTPVINAAMKGTGFVLCAVLGLPSGSSMLSELP